MRTKKEVLYTCLTNQIVPDKKIETRDIHEEVMNCTDDCTIVDIILAAMQEYATEWSKAGEEENDLDSYIENLEQEWK